MSAPQITEASPGETGSLAPPDIRVVGPVEQWPPRLASVTAIPANGDTGPIEPVADEPEPNPDFDRASRSAATIEPTYSEPVKVQPPPPEPDPTSEPKPLVDPNTSFKDFPAERFYPVIYWLAVSIGLVSQVVGWSKVFGGGPKGYITAAIVGGICELTMVATGDKGLNWLARGMRPREFLPFFALSTATACIAVYMVATHWHGSIGLYLAVVSALGWLGHMLDGGFKATRQRRLVQEYQRQVDAERQRAEEAQRQAEQDAERQRQAAVEAEQQRREAAEAERRRSELAAQIGDEPPQPTRKGQKITKEQAFALGVHKNATTPAAMRAAIGTANFAVPSETSVKNYAAEVKKHLG